MRLLIWGVGNIGKTSVGRLLAKKLNIKFYDVDEDFILRDYPCIDFFQYQFSTREERYNAKADYMQTLLEQEKDDFVLAVSPIYSVFAVNRILKIKDVINIEITDTVQAIYDRLVFEDLDPEETLQYKEERKYHYIRDIINDQTASYEEWRNIEKVAIDNQTIEEAVETVYKYLKDKNYI